MDSSNAPTFKQQELSGWTAKAKNYNDYAGAITRNAVQPLLAAVGIEFGSRLLDVACGPGYVAGGAFEQGAKAIGMDFSPTMVSQATSNFPQCEFREGDAEALPFDSNTFDAVVCAFGLLHLTEPDKAIEEAFRVLRPGGRYAFTVWATLDRHEFFNLVLAAIKTHGTLDVPLPPAPPMFRFSDPKESERALSKAGFKSVQVTELPLVWETKSPGEALDLLYKSTVRTAMMLEMQSPDALERIHQAVLDQMLRLKTGEVMRLAWPAVMTVAEKPL